MNDGPYVIAVASNPHMTWEHYHSLPVSTRIVANMFIIFHEEKRRKWTCGQRVQYILLNKKMQSKINFVIKKLNLSR